MTDHLQSSSILVDNSGDIAEISDFKPFGTDAYTSVTTDMDNDYTFTGKEKGFFQKNFYIRVEEKI